jgi:large subunit ribosomal protein L19e
MNLANQKVLAAKAAGVGLGRVMLVPERSAEIKDAITKTDIRALIKSGAIKISNTRTPSRGRAKIRHAQKLRGRRRGQSRRKGASGARAGKKSVWINKIRLLRRTLQTLREQDKLSTETYHQIYRRAKGGFFRDRGHMLFYLEQNKLMK